MKNYTVALYRGDVLIGYFDTEAQVEDYIEFMKKHKEETKGLRIACVKPEI